MKPKEKAEQLVHKFWHIEPLESCDGMEYKMALDCALIAVDELIKETGSKYWYDVKQEIENI
jgi:hypothetical protein